MTDTIVFIPAWNEAANLPAVLDGLRTELPYAALLVVDDGSTDRTADVAREHGAEVLSLGENKGLRVGIAAGYAGHSSTATRTAAAWTRTVSIRRTSSPVCWRSFATAVAMSRSVRASCRATATPPTATGRARRAASGRGSCAAR